MSREGSIHNLIKRILEVPRSATAWTALVAGENLQDFLVGG